MLINPKQYLGLNYKKQKEKLWEVKTILNRDEIIKRNGFNSVNVTDILVSEKDKHLKRFYVSIWITPNSGLAYSEIWKLYLKGNEF